jgi:predicted CopG family antitoxin
MNYSMHKIHELTTISVSRENYLTLEELGGASDSFNDVISEILRKPLATAIESEAGATRIISEDDLGHDF